MSEDKPQEVSKPSPEVKPQPEAGPQQASKPMEVSISRKYIAELIGTLALVFFGCGAAVVAGAHVGFLGIAFAFGITVLVMVYAIGPISGCHINPAITVAMLAAKRISLKDAIAYIIAQCIGAFIGAAILLSVMSGHPGYDLGANGLGQNGYGDHSPDHYDLARGSWRRSC